MSGQNTSNDPLRESTDIEFLRAQAMYYRHQNAEMEKLFKTAMKECLKESSDKRDCGRMLDTLTSVNVHLNSTLMQERAKNDTSETFILNICRNMNDMCEVNADGSSNKKHFTFKDLIIMIQQEYKKWNSKYWKIGKK